MSGSGISWAICKSAPCSSQITMPVPHHSVFTGRMPFLPPNQQHQSTKGKAFLNVNRHKNCLLHLWSWSCRQREHRARRPRCVRRCVETAAAAARRPRSSTTVHAPAECHFIHVTGFPAHRSYNYDYNHFFTTDSCSVCYSVKSHHNTQEIKTVTTTITALWPLYTSTSISQHLQLS